MDDKETAALGCLLQSNPALESQNFEYERKNLKLQTIWHLWKFCFLSVELQTQVMMCHGIIGENQYFPFLFSFMFGQKHVKTIII